VLHLEGHALGRVDRHRVAVPERELERRTLGHNAVADAEDLHGDGVAVGYAVTMFCSNVRESPCADRLSRASLTRVTCSVPSSADSRPMTSCRSSSKVPLGPVTDTWLPSTATSTP